MEENSKLPKNMRLILPDNHKEEEEEAGSNLLGKLVISMDDVLGMDERKESGEKRLQLVMEDAIEDEEEEKEQEIEEEETREYDSRHVALDDLPKEDFFEAREGEEEQQFGAIEGMAEVAEEDEENPYIEASVNAQRLSLHAQKFGEEMTTMKRDSSVKGSPDLVREKSEEERSTTTEEATSGGPETTEEEENMRRTTVDFKPDRSEEAQKNIDLSLISSSSRESQISKGLISARESGYSMERPTIYYEYSARLNDSEADLLQFFNLDKPEKVVLLDDFEKEAEEEEVMTEVEEEAKALDRVPYYDKYEKILEKISDNRVRNNILQKKLTMYLKRRKVENFLKDSEAPLDQLHKYNQKLDAYQQILEVNTAQRLTVTDELDGLKNRRMEQSVKLDKLFRTMQTRECNVGYGLIHTKTGNPIPDKLVERLIRRQKTQSEQVSTMRLKFLKLKGMVQEKLDAIDQLDQLENNLRLGDYEQLKVENRNYADKIEERDEELTRLRTKCQNTIQILAHMREKSAALESDVNDLREELDYAETVADHNRAHIAHLKLERDKYRDLTATIKAESGLLVQLDLLRDMEASQKEIQKMQLELQHCQEDVNLKTAQVRILRKNIERRTEILNRRKAAKLKGKHSSNITLSVRSDTEKFSRSSRVREEEHKPWIYSGRPTMLLPIIKPSAFHDIVKIKPNPVTSTRKRR